eukprot:TRINITY_DN94052_c0_g1_i1.p1 TRINITY_DN94052_c0_g1~~TRINITY_DN94052_c0_g1_i1.p1  ORF type:complete len:773 (+),score=23.15 TRINITY_DN94052_c0_g1_i1:44-2362(+)
MQLLVIWWIAGCAMMIQATPLHTIGERLHSLMLIQPASPVLHKVDAEVEWAVDSLAPDGTWADIDYGDKGRSWWKTALHMQRCWLICIAYESPASRWYKNSTVLEATQRSFWWWLRTDPINPNWWWNDIGIPSLVGKRLLLLPTNETQLKVARVILERSGSSWMTGCNRVWRALAQVMYGVAENNSSRVVTAVGEWRSTVVKAKSRDAGIQPDWSFHQHGPLLYSGWGYGAIFSTNVLVLLNITNGLPQQYTLQKKQLELFTSFVLIGQQLATRGPLFDFSACGRLMTYFTNTTRFGVNLGHYHYFAAFVPFENAFPSFAPPFVTALGVNFANLLDTVPAFKPFSQRLHGKLPPASVHRHFWTSDYSVHHRPTFTSTVHMYSDNTINTECVNSENKQGKFLANGALTVRTHGLEYADIFPVWDWWRIPGTTAELVPSWPLSCCTDRHSTCGDCDRCIQNVTHSAFVGGVSDGQYGCSVLEFDSHAPSTLRIQKTYFYFDDCVVAMGTGLERVKPSSMVITSIDQRNLNGDVLFWENSEEYKLHEKSTTTFHAGNASIWHDGVATFVLSENSTLNISNQDQTGSWGAITQGGYTPITKPVFSATLHHIPPYTGGYLYLMAPSSMNDVLPLKQRLLSNLEFVRQDRQAQVVWRKQPDLLQAIIWADGTNTRIGTWGGGAGVSFSSAGLYMLQQTTGEYSEKIVMITGASPSATGSVKITLHSLNVTGHGPQFHCDGNKVHLVLPLERGMSVTARCRVQSDVCRGREACKTVKLH